MFVRKWKLTSHKPHLDCSGWIYTLQAFGCFFNCPKDFRCVSKRIIYPYRNEFVLRRVLSSLKDLANIEYWGYSAVTDYGLPIFLIWEVYSEALLLWSEFYCESVCILLSLAYFLWSFSYFNTCIIKKPHKVQKSQGVISLQLLSSSPSEISSYTSREKNTANDISWSIVKHQYLQIW